MRVGGAMAAGPKPLCGTRGRRPEGGAEMPQKRTTANPAAYLRAAWDVCGADVCSLLQRGELEEGARRDCMAA